MTPATPKPRAGEHTPETDAVAEKWGKEHIYMQIEAEHGEIYGHARKLEVERDALAAQNAELLEICQCAAGGHYQTKGGLLVTDVARALLAKRGR